MNGRRRKVSPASAYILALMFFFSGLLPACNGSTSVSSNPYSKHFSLQGDSLVFEAPFSAILNDGPAVGRSELKTGDFLRIPQTEEAGDILRVIEITDKYALVEFRHYSAPPATDKPEEYRFKIYPSAR